MLVDAIYAVRRQNVTIPQFLARYALPGILVFGTLSLFYRSTAFFDGLDDAERVALQGVLARIIEGRWPASICTS